MNASSSYPGLIAFSAVLLLVPIIRSLCTRLRLFDLPGPLKIHTRPIPRFGGVAIALAVLLGVVAVHLPMGRSEWFTLLAATLVWTPGLIDDVRSLHPAIRLIAQIVAGSLVVHTGWVIPLSGNAVVNATGTCLYIVLFVNAFNFLDGADGIAAGIAAIIAMGYIALPTIALNALGHAIAWSLLGACTAFLFSNFPPATIFMGDSGSSIIGFAAAFLGLAFCREIGPTKSALSPLLFSLIVAALPLLDAGMAVLRRIRSRASPLYGDRRHFYDLLLARGYTARQVALACYALTAVLVIAGWFAQRQGNREALVVSALIACTLFGIEVRMGALRSKDTSQNSSAQEDPRWRQMADQGLRGKA